MTRYILIDNQSGYIWGDTADINGKPAKPGTPIEAARILDESLGEHGREYEEVSRHSLASDEPGYFIYRADINGSEAVPVVWDGQDQETIEAIERYCEYVTAIRIKNA